MAGPKKTRGGKAGSKTVATYERIPIVFSIGGSKYASAEEKQQRKETITRFMNEAQAGNVYRTGAGVGSSGSEFEVIQRGDKLALKWSNSNSRAVDMNRANVESFIRNGARLILRKRK